MDMEPAGLLELHGRIKDAYPQVLERRRWTQEIVVKDGAVQAPVTQDLGLNGYQFASADNKRVAQFRLDGFTFSRLKPYEDWEKFQGEARRLWETYASLKPRVRRVAVRYINIIDIPLPITEFRDFLPSIPPAPQEMNLGLAAFLNRVGVIDQNGEFQATISQALQPPSNPTVATVLLDIDVFKEQEFDLDYINVWKILDRYHAVKNELFFHAITEKTVELLK